MIRLSSRSDETSKRATSAVIDLLRDHLQAALDHCEAITASRLVLGASVASGANGRTILRQNSQITRFVADLRARELAIALRLMRAGVVAKQGVDISPTLRPVAMLIGSGAAMLVDTATRLATDAGDPAAFTYLVERGLVPADATCLPDVIDTCDGFIALGVMAVVDVRAFLDAALTALDALV